MNTPGRFPMWVAFLTSAVLSTALNAQVPQMINYQGRVTVSGVNFEGSGQFRFALVNAAGTTTYWSNDGTGTAGSQPAAAVTLTVTKGLYSVVLGDTSITNMTAVPNAVFNNSDVHLRVWFSDGTHGVQLLTPDQRITAVGYAMTAANVPDGTITGAKLAPGAASANLNASGQSGVPSGGLILSATENPSLTAAGYVRRGTMMVGDAWGSDQGTGAPSGRYHHTAVWTGTEMIIWGGYNASGPLGDGARYNPVTSIWTPVNPAGAPAARLDHTAVWTGSEMLIWGGQGSQVYAEGARYNPSTNTWTPMATANAPAGRYLHTAVWTGTEMMVWGGWVNGNVNSGGRYNAATNTWSAISTNNMPGGRRSHTATWTGSVMIIWGGTNGNIPGDWGEYNPLTNTWYRSSGSADRQDHTAVWSGSEMLVWGGRNSSGFTTTLAEGLRYRPSDHSGAIIPAFDLKSRAGATSVWTGEEMYVWGGFQVTSQSGARNYNGQGARYAPGQSSADERWTMLNDALSPAGREGHTAVWTGNEMIVWGGFNPGLSVKYPNEVNRYEPFHQMVLYQRP